MAECDCDVSIGHVWFCPLSRQPDRPRAKPPEPKDFANGCGRCGGLRCPGTCAPEPKADKWSMSKEWCMEMAKLEEGVDVCVGRPSPAPQVNGEVKANPTQADLVKYLLERDKEIFERLAAIEAKLK